MRSIDNTLSIVTQVAKEWDVPVRIISNGPIGIGGNWHHFVKKAKGKFIKFLFQDGIIYPDCVLTLVEQVKDENEIGLLC